MVDGAQNTRTGGALLRLLEHGQGPTIEIAWPQRVDARRALYRQLSQCYGVKAALLTGGAKLYANAGHGGPGLVDQYGPVQRLYPLTPGRSHCRGSAHPLRASPIVMA